MQRLILGTAGHIDHGKTALVRALTGTDTDRLPEEKRRGITIDLGFASLEVDGFHIGIVDVPGHEAFIRNMLAGATGIDVALLVVAADEGVMPQTREHLAIVEFLGVRQLVVALTKADLVEEDWLQLVRDEVAERLSGTPWPDARIQPVSVVSGRGLPELRSLLAATAERAGARTADSLFRLPIDRVFTVRGTGTVVTGTVWSGAIERDAQVQALPAGVPARVRGVQSHGVETGRVGAGERAALALAGPARDALGRGDVLVSADGWLAAPMITARVVCASTAPPLRMRQRVRFHLGTAEVMGRLVVLEGSVIEPGAQGWAQLRLETPVVARAGDRFVLRSWSPVTTIAGGVVVEPGAPRRTRVTTATRDLLEEVLKPEPALALAAAARLAGWSGLPQTRVAMVLAPHASDAFGKDDAVVHVGSNWFHSSIVDEAEAILLMEIERHHAAQPLSPGVHRDVLRQALPARAPAALADAVLLRLTGRGAIEARGHNVCRRGWNATLDPDQTAATRTILAFVKDAGFAAPALGELSGELASRSDIGDLVRHLVRTGELVAIPQDRFLSRESAARAVEQVRAAFAVRPSLAPSDFRDLFGISRKYLIPLLEHLDRAGITIRSGDTRVLAGSPGA